VYRPLCPRVNPYPNYRNSCIGTCCDSCEVQERAFQTLYYLSAKIVERLKCPLLYLTKQESS